MPAVAFRLLSLVHILLPSQSHAYDYASVEGHEHSRCGTIESRLAVVRIPLPARKIPGLSIVSTSDMYTAACSMQLSTALFQLPSAPQRYAPILKMSYVYVFAVYASRTSR